MPTCALHSVTSFLPEARLIPSSPSSLLEVMLIGPLQITHSVSLLWRRNCSATL